jgi:hypothetical protein
MPSFTFTVDDEPPHSGFSLGQLDVAGSAGTATTRGHTPDQRVMVYLSAAQLLWDVRVLVDNGRGKRSFVGADSSFTLEFTLNKGKVRTRHAGAVIDESDVSALCSSVLTAARELHEHGSREVEADPKPLDELAAAISKFESWRS